MENKNNNGLLIMIGIVVGAAILAFGISKIRSNNEAITVKGYAEQNVKSDLTVWRIVINSRSSNLADAFSNLSKSKTRVYDFLKQSGIPNDQLTETSLQSSQNIDYNNNQNITGYTMSQSVVVTSKNIEQINSLSLQINNLLSEGIDINSQPPEYYVSDIGKYKVQMLGEALKDAKKRADEIAKGVGNSIGSLKSARQGIFQITPLNSTEVSDWGINDVTSVEKTIKSVVDASFYIK